MRRRLQHWVRQLPDLSFYPESVLVSQALADPVTFGSAHRQDIAHLADIADLAFIAFADAEPALRSALVSANAWERYWSLIACSCFGQAAVSLADEARVLLSDTEPLVRVRAAEFLAILGLGDPQATLVDVLNSTGSVAEALVTLNTVVFVNDCLDVERIRADDLKLQVTDSELDRRLAYLADG